MTEASDKPKLCELSPELDPWERQPDESALWYGRFELFLNLPPSQRKLIRTYKMWAADEDDQREREGLSRKKRNFRRLPGSWEVNKRYWRWVERAEAKDESDRIERASRNRDRIRQLEELEWKASQQLFERAKEMAEYPLVTQTLQDNGQTIVIRPQAWTAADAARYLVVGSELGRKAVGADIKIDALSAIQVLVNEGWLPDSFLVEASSGVEGLADRLRAALEQGHNDAIDVEAYDDSDDEEDP